MSQAPDSPGRQRRRISPAWVLLPLFLLVQPALSPAGTSSLEQQREQFLEAEKALEKGDKQRFAELRGQLHHYPLAPYLDYQQLIRELDQASPEQVEHFLQEKASTPLAGPLRSAWLGELAKRKRWWVFLAFYERPGSTDLRCLQARALLETGQKKAAYQVIRSLWLSGSSRPDSCDQPFAQWRADGKLTRDLLWQRIRLAMEKDNLKLARYLKRFLPKKQQPWLDNWLQLYRKPESTLRLVNASVGMPGRQAMLVQGIKRLAGKEAQAARQLLAALPVEMTPSKAKRYPVERHILLRQLKQDAESGYRELQVFRVNAEDDYLLETRLREAIKRQDWQQLLAWSRQLPAEMADSERWRYWRARAELEAGDRYQGKKILEILARERSYHGFLAADWLKLPYNLNHQVLQPDKTLLRDLSRKPAALRARELVALERFTDARREWRLLNRKLDKNGLKATAKLAQSWGWNDQAIFTLARSGYWEDLELRFPLQHKQPVKRHAASQSLSPSWVYAVIRQESAFNPQARSRVGARGLMQLMPATARHVAKRLNLSRPGPAELLTPAINIKLGTAYLREVLDKLSDNPVLATAAYNAGPRRVSSWLPVQSVSAEIWIESIPFTETRTYTQRVMTYSVIYDKRMGKQPGRMSQRMPLVAGTSEQEKNEKLAALKP